MSTDTNPTKAINHSLEQQVYQSIQRLGYLQLAHLECAVHDRQVTLYGESPSYYLKQLAQTVACQVPGVQKVVNKISVRPEIDE